VVFVRDTLRSPAELYSAKLDGSDLKQITHFNDARVKAITWGDYEQFSFKGAKGDTVHGFVVKPAGSAGTGGGKVPVAFLIHGGPQGSFGDHFHYRWNPEVYAGHGFGVVMIDFHGLDRLRPGVHRCDLRRLGRRPVRRPDDGLDAALASYTCSTRPGWPRSARRTAAT